MAQGGMTRSASSSQPVVLSHGLQPQRSRTSRWRRILVGTLAAVLAVVLIVSGFLTWSVMRAFPQTDGTIAVAGLQGEVTVQRDSHGIPTLTAGSTDDLFRAQGFVHAQDRFWEMDFRRHMTSGRLSELFGEAQVGTDSFLRTLGWHRIAQEEVDALPPDVLGYYEAYAAGVNAYLEERKGGGLGFEYTVLGLQNREYAPEPWTPTDSVAWLKAMAWDLRTNIEDETARALLGQNLDPDRLAELYPAYPFTDHPVILAEDPDGASIATADIPPPTEDTTAEAGTGPSSRPAEAAPPATAETGTAGPSADDEAGAAGSPADEGTGAGTGTGADDRTGADSGTGAGEGTGADEGTAASGAVGSGASQDPSSASVLPPVSGDPGGLSDLLRQVDDLMGSAGEGVGSNSWVVSGEHTATGEPLLANDPHLGASLPSVWTQMQLRCTEVTEACPFNVAGYSFSGLPGIVIGHNQQVAWGFTNLTTDVADLYVERIVDEGYLRDGEIVPFENRQETLKVAGGDDVILDVRSTVHGPVISGLTPDFTDVAADPRVSATEGARERLRDPASGADPIPLDEQQVEDPVEAEKYALSLRWTALDAGTTAQAIFSLNLADDFSDFRLAASQFDVPAQNLIYADVGGNIGYQAPGRLPIRGEGDGWLPQPGWDSAFDWQGFIPFEEQPVVYNPESGYIVTANNAIVNDDYAHFLSRDWDYGYRGARIVELLEGAIEARPVTAADMAAIQMDNQFPAAEALQKAYEGAESGSADASGEDVEAALALLAEWNGQNDPESAGAAFANVLWSHVTQEMIETQGAIVDLEAEEAAGEAAGEVDGEAATGEAATGAVQESASEGTQESAHEPPLQPTIARDDQSRLVLFFAQQLEDEDSPWWGGSQDDVLRAAAEGAVAELQELQGTDPDEWNWGELHALPLTHGTFGSSGITPVEALFNRGPYPTGGGSGVVNATGWDMDEGFATSTVPSFRMVIDVSDWDQSTWHNLTGQSGHAFNSHYTDQADEWARGEQYPWAFSAEAVDQAAEDTLTLTP